MFFTNNNNKKNFTEDELLNNPKIIKKVKKLSNSELISIIEESINKKEWIKINAILQNISEESRKIVSKEVKENSIMDYKIHKLLFKKKQAQLESQYADIIFREIDKNTDW